VKVFISVKRGSLSCQSVRQARKKGFIKSANWYYNSVGNQSSRDCIHNTLFSP